MSNRVATNKRLKAISIESEENTDYCKNVTEDLPQVFLSCPNLRNSWIKVENWINIS